MIKEWKVCKICDKYLISNDGEIKSLKTGKILKQKLRYDNVLMVHLSLGNRYNTRHFMVHRLVAEAFIPNPDNKPFVKHIDGNIINNEVSNLEWSDVRDLYQPQGENANNAKLTNEQAKYCREVYVPRDKIYGLSALAKQFNVSKSTMSYVINNKTYK